jgi:hypothetical protein
MREIVIALAHGPCPPVFDHWFAMRLASGEFGLVRFLNAPGETGDGERSQAAAALLRPAIAAADVILLEENEASIGSTRQIDELWRALHPEEAAGEGPAVQSAAEAARPAMRAYSP